MAFLGVLTEFLKDLCWSDVAGCYALTMSIFVAGLHRDSMVPLSRSHSNGLFNLISCDRGLNRRANTCMFGC